MPAEAREGASRPWLRASLLMALVVAFVGLLAFGFTRNPKEIPSPLVGGPAAPFTLERLDGGELRVADLRGKIVVLNFWASWCYPACWNEAPRLEGAWRRHREHDVVVVGSVYQDTAANARDFVRQHGKTFPNGLPAGRVPIDYGVYGVPETFFIDRDGRIAHKHTGEISESVLEMEIQKLLAAPRAARGPAGDGRP
ncbi:MAG TPA: TlpA disulfide reductase family protein [Candidatus Methylomirabilis sp.]|jgi:cytochrome c biogenesis protein CcmG/thiol:disulfide interchange protein DsbE